MSPISEESLGGGEKKEGNDRVFEDSSSFAGKLTTLNRPKSRSIDRFRYRGWVARLDAPPRRGRASKAVHVLDKRDCASLTDRCVLAPVRSK